MGKLILSLLAVFVTIIAGCSSGNEETTPSQTDGTYVDISASEAKDLIDDTPQLVIIDVSPVYDEGHLPGAINHPYGSGALEAAIPSLNQSVPYLVYCHSDSVSIAGAKLLVDSEFPTVYRLAGNYAAWVAEDYQIGITATVDWTADGGIASGEYTSSRRLNRNYELYWRMDAENIYIGMRAETDGWVAIGFDPRSRMDEADIILGFVSNGQTSIIDSIGTAPISSHPEDTDEGGTADIIEFAGSESGESTIIEFKRLLTTGDAQDKSLSEGPVEIIWAYGSGDNPSQQHSDRGTSEIILGLQ